MLLNKLSKYFFHSEILLICLACALLLGAGIINIKNDRPVLELNKQDTAININKNLLLFVSAGNRRLFTDLIWVQTLIESDVEQYQKKDLNNWLFLRFITVAALDPKFYENYLYGGQFLAIVKDDLEGADTLYDKALEIYPDDYQLNYGSGFLNYYELGNYEKGTRRLEKIKNNPKAPVYLPSIINKLKLENGLGIEEVFKLVLHDYEMTQDEGLKSRLKSDLYSLKADIDLTCLNQSKGNCNQKDLDGISYVKKGNSYFAAKAYLPYKIKRREAIRPPFPEQ